MALSSVYCVILLFCAFQLLNYFFLARTEELRYNLLSIGHCVGPGAPVRDRLLVDHLVLETDWIIKIDYLCTNPICTRLRKGRPVALLRRDKVQKDCT